LAYIAKYFNKYAIKMKANYAVFVDYGDVFTVISGVGKEGNADF
jgi:hypothetical protein